MKSILGSTLSLLWRNHAYFSKCWRVSLQIRWRFILYVPSVASKTSQCLLITQAGCCSSSRYLMRRCTQTAAQLHSCMITTHVYDHRSLSSHQFGSSHNKGVLNYLAKTLTFVLTGFMFSGCWQAAAKHIGLLWCNALIWSVERSSVTSSSWDWYAICSHTVPARCPSGSARGHPLF